MAQVFLPYAALMPLMGAAAFTYDGIFTGANWAAAMRNQMLVAFAAYLVALWLLADFGNHGIWLALLGFMALRGTAQAIMLPGLARRAFAPQAEPMKMPASSTSAPPTTT